MPVTITLPAPGGVIAPWTQIHFSSDFIGPLPSGSHWFGQVYSSPEPSFLTVAYDFRVPTQVGSGSVRLGIPAQNEGFSVHEDAVINEAVDAHLTVELRNGADVVIDSGTVTGKWQPVTNILNQPRTTGGQGGLTTEQAQQLTETHAATFTDQLLDNLLLQEITSGPQGGFVNANLGGWIWGVIVRITNVPADLVPDTPDGDYWLPSLAVVRIYRASDLWLRVPVHTSSKMVSLLNEGVVAAVTALTLTQWLAQMSVQVSFREGVLGRVYLMRQP